VPILRVCLAGRSAYILKIKFEARAVSYSKTRHNPNIQERYGFCPTSHHATKQQAYKGRRGTDKNTPGLGTGIRRYMANIINAMQHFRKPLATPVYQEPHSLFVSLESFAELLKDKRTGLLGLQLQMR
jgi:hypothetical protein